MKTLIITGIIVAVIAIFMAVNKKFTRKLINYFKESYTELVHKTSWPTRKELTSSSIVVLVATVIIALVVWAMDFSFEKIMTLIYKYI